MKKWEMIILENGEKVDVLMKLAANKHLTCLYKIGIYGTETQHELYVKGSWLNRWAFKKAVEESED